jgi:hypothetical protein
MRLGRPPAGGVRPHSCLLCTADYASQSGLQLHYHKVHGMDGSLSEIYGPRCALCGETSNRNHASTVHGEPITQVMRDAERKGDPFGVVRTLRAGGQGAWLTRGNALESRRVRLPLPVVAVLWLRDAAGAWTGCRPIGRPGPDGRMVAEIYRDHDATAWSMACPQCRAVYIGDTAEPTAWPQSDVPWEHLPD